MPLSMLFPQPLPERASPLPGGMAEAEVRVEYASIFVDSVRKGERILVDGEFSRSALVFRYGFGEDAADGAPRRPGVAEIGLEIPFLRYSSGRFDSFIESWHDFFGMPQGRRDGNPDNRFGVVYSGSRGTYLTAGEDGFHLGDVPLFLKVGLLDPATERIGMAVRGVLELPTGDEGGGFGSGGLDGGVGMLLEKRFGGMALYLSLDEVFRKTPDSFRGVEAAHVTHASLAAEYRLFESASIILQTDFQTQPLTGSRLSELDGYQWMGVLGGAFRLTGGTTFRLAVAEGLTVNSSPDFTVLAGLVSRF